MTKTQREEWDNWVERVQKYAASPAMNDSMIPLIIPMDVYVRKLERELQALKNKKTMAALLMKKA